MIASQRTAVRKDTPRGRNEMKNLKRMMMLTLALVLVLTSAVSAFAEEGTATELSEVMADAGAEDVIACEADESIGIMEEASPADAECADEALVGAGKQPQEPVEYVFIYPDGRSEKRMCTSYIEINSETVEPAGGYEFHEGWYVVKGEVTFKERIKNKGVYVYLILTDGCVFNVPKGIDNVMLSSLSIRGQELNTGTLNIDNVENGNAGIGGIRHYKSGNVTIFGGRINVTGGPGGAGIGAPYGASSGTIAISGGEVTAFGGDHAAGIGGGNNEEAASITCGKIDITGGKVTAAGGYRAAGIGGGSSSLAHSINIKGGYVEAIGGVEAAAFRSYNGPIPTFTLGTGMTLYVEASSGKETGVSDIKMYDFEDRYARAMPKSNVVLSVRFETNGGSMMFPQAVKCGESAKKPKDPSKEGFEFSGWYSDAALTVPYDFASPVFENTTLYAKWKTVRVPDDSEDESEPFFTGTPEKPVSNGAWMQNTDGTWTYVTTRRFTDTWGYIANPWNDNKPAWFRFDGNGKMLTGWQMILWNGSYKFFYFREAADGRRGECLIDGVSPDGYTVNKDGAWTVDGVVQEYVPASSSGGTGFGPASALPAVNDAGGLIANNSSPKEAGGLYTVISQLSLPADTLEVAVPGTVRAIPTEDDSLKPVQGGGSPLDWIVNTGAQDEMRKPQVIEPSDKQRIVIQ